MNKRSRLKDIADEVGVSVNSVSLALNGSPRINEKTRLRIEETAKKLNYIPNRLASSLVRSQTNTIGLLLPRMTNPVFASTAQRIEIELMAHGYNMILMTTDHDPADQANAVDALLSREVDGIFMYPSKPMDWTKIRSVRMANYPLVLLSGGDFDCPIDAVYMNQYLGTYTSTLHLKNLGHKNIAFLGGGTVIDSEKHRGYKTAMEEDGGYHPELVISVNEVSCEQGYAAAPEILKRKPHPTAIMTSGDYLAVGALRWFHDRGIRVPEDMALIGYDDLEMSRFTEVALSSVTNNYDELAAQAVNLMLSLISQKDSLSDVEPRHIAIEPKLTVRDSCGVRQPTLH